MLKIRNLSKQYDVPGGQIRAVRDLNLTVEEGRFFVLLGPSGCGKSTLLRCIAGLEQPVEGEIRLGEKLLYSAKDNLAMDPEDREIAMVFQSYAIWPHMSVFENVSFPLTEAKKRRYSANQIAPKVKDALELVRLAGFERHSAATLSGGQQQRVALARALIREPKLLLMDEPLSNLDAQLREEMRDEIKELTHSLGVTTLHVTHDQTEAMALADTLAVMHDGNILEIGKPEILYRQPSHQFVAEFLGRTNWIEGVVEANGSVKTDIGLLSCPLPNNAARGTTLTLGIRSEWLELSTQRSNCNSFVGTVEMRNFLGDVVIYWVRIGAIRLMVKTTFTDLKVGSSVNVIAPSERWLSFVAKTIGNDLP